MPARNASPTTHTNKMHLLTLLAALATTSLAALPHKGADWSSLLLQESAGKSYSNAAGQTLPLETILKTSGVNTVRQRVWVNPPNGDYNLEYNLRLARRAKAAGLKIYLDFHYSDNWADPGKQVVPAAWKSLGRDALVGKVYEYTKGVVDAFAKEGLGLDVVSIGNEITPGLLHPVGKMGSGEGAGNVAALLSTSSLIAFSFYSDQIRC
jgi:arabinogalactan endo-1,4-beta-galactosidase